MSLTGVSVWRDQHGRRALILGDHHPAQNMSLLKRDTKLLTRAISQWLRQNDDSKSSQSPMLVFIGEVWAKLEEEILANPAAAFVGTVRGATASDDSNGSSSNSGSNKNNSTNKKKKGKGRGKNKGKGRGKNNNKNKKRKNNQNVKDKQQDDHHNNTVEEQNQQQADTKQSTESDHADNAQDTKHSEADESAAIDMSASHAQLQAQLESKNKNVAMIDAYNHADRLNVRVLQHVRQLLVDSGSNYPGLRLELAPTRHMSFMISFLLMAIKFWQRLGSEEDVAAEEDRERVRRFLEHAPDMSWSTLFQQVEEAKKKALAAAVKQRNSKDAEKYIREQIAHIEPLLEKGQQFQVKYSDGLDEHYGTSFFRCVEKDADESITLWSSWAESLAHLVRNLEHATRVMNALEHIDTTSGVRSVSDSRQNAHLVLCMDHNLSVSCVELLGSLGFKCRSYTGTIERLIPNQVPDDAPTFEKKLLENILANAFVANDVEKAADKRALQQRLVARMGRLDPDRITELSDTTVPTQSMTTTSASPPGPVMSTSSNSSKSTDNQSNISLSAEEEALAKRILSQPSPMIYSNCKWCLFAKKRCVD
jgi:hypothetical protein